jgi:hypothetical protein
MRAFSARRSRGREVVLVLVEELERASNMRLLIVVSMVNTLSFEFATFPIRSTLVARADDFGSMYEWQLRMVFGLWCARRLS